MNGIFTFIFACILFLVSSCNSQKSAAASLPATAILEPIENSIVYLFFEIEKNDGNIEKITLTEKKITQGVMKNASIDNKENIAGNLLISMLGNDGEVVEERIIEDPLNPLMEVYSDDGLSKSKINLKKAEFSIRFNQKGEIAAVKIEKITQNSKNTLLTLKL